MPAILKVQELKVLRIPLVWDILGMRLQQRMHCPSRLMLVVLVAYMLVMIIDEGLYCMQAGAGMEVFMIKTGFYDK